MHKLRTLVSVVMVGLLFCTQSYAADHLLSGTITARSGQALDGVTVSAARGAARRSRAATAAARRTRASTATRSCASTLTLWASATRHLRASLAAARARGT